MNLQREKNRGETAKEEVVDVVRIRVVIAEEQPNIRKALRLLLSAEPDMEIIGEVNNGFDALDMVGVLHPDILILGLNASNILEIVRLINQRFPKTVIIVSRNGDNEDRILEMMRAGVKVYALKKTSAIKFINTIREVYESQIKLSSQLSERGAGKTTRYLEKSNTIDPYEVLTIREREVFKLVVDGLTNTMIAERLSISRRTVEIHRANMMRKLGLRNQHEQLVKYAIERNILG